MFRDSAAPSAVPASSANVAQLLVFLCCGLSVSGLYGQALIPRANSGALARLRPADLAVLGAREPRDDLHCTVSHTKPELDWDFTFHTGYQAMVPLADLVDGGNELTILFRVIPEERPDDTAFLVQKLRIPAIEKGSKGKSAIQGIFTVGEGKYHVDWLMRDQQDRVCAASWDLETKLDSKDGPLREWIPRTRVQPVAPLFEETAPAMRPMDSSLPHVSIIVNFDPQEAWATKPHDEDIEGLVGILRRIASDPHIGTYSIVACSLMAQQVVYGTDHTNTLDLKALGKALESLKLGTVDAKQLASAKGPAQFATELIRDHLKTNKPDALIVLGRKAVWVDRVSHEAQVSLPSTSVFYLSYNTDRQFSVQPDPVSTIVKRLRGFEYGISRPKDLFKAWSDVLSRISRTK